MGSEGTQELVFNMLTATTFLGALCGAMFLFVASLRPRWRKGEGTLLQALYLSSGFSLFLGFLLGGFVAILGPTSYVTSPATVWTIAAIYWLEVIIVIANMTGLFVSWMRRPPLRPSS